MHCRGLTADGDAGRIVIAAVAVFVEKESVIFALANFPIASVWKGGVLPRIAACVDRDVIQPERNSGGGTLLFRLDEVAAAVAVPDLA